MWYVYTLATPDGKIFYVGKGKNNRMYRHEYLTKLNIVPNGNRHLFHTIKNILSENKKIIYNKLYETDVELEAFEKEKHYIQMFGVDNLCNLTLGGDGMSPTDEVKLKLSKKRTGYKHTNETKLKIKNSQKERFSDSSERKKISEATKLGMADPEIRKRISLTKIGKAPPNKGKSTKKVKSVCIRCGKEKIDYRVRKYCSIKCRSVEVKCTYCGVITKKGEASVKGSELHFCNRTCYGKYITGNNHPKRKNKRAC